MSSGSDKGQHEVLPHRLNEEPAIFRGASLSELVFLSVSGLLVSIPILLILCWMIFGSPMMGIGMSIISTIGVVFWGTKLVAKIKRGRSIGYYQVRLRIILQKLGRINQSKFIIDDQLFDIGSRDAK